MAPQSAYNRLMNRYLLMPLIATTALYAQASESVSDACRSLQDALNREASVLEQIQNNQDADEMLPELRAVLQQLAALSVVDENELWLYIDNTEGVKQPLVDALSQIALQFSRLEAAGFYHHAGLRELLAPQTEETPDVRRAKLEKIHAVDHDDD